MEIYLVANLKTTEDFNKMYKVGDEKNMYHGESLIFYSLRNNDPMSRYEISKILLENDVDVLGKNTSLQTPLHILLGHITHNVKETCELCEELLNRGVDINAQDYRGQSALHFVVSMINSDEELCPLYDLFLKNDKLDCKLKNIKGKTVLELAKKDPNRALLVERLEKYEERK